MSPFPASAVALHAVTNVLIGLNCMNKPTPDSTIPFALLLLASAVPLCVYGLCLRCAFTGSTWCETFRRGEAGRRVLVNNRATRSRSEIRQPCRFAYTHVQY
jgi:hypothetical protein